MSKQTEKASQARQARGEDARRRIAAAAARGLTVAQIGYETGFDDKHVRQTLKRMGLQAAPAGYKSGGKMAARRVKGEERRAAVRAAFERGLEPMEIAARLQISRAYVMDILVAMGLRPGRAQSYSEEVLADAEGAALWRDAKAASAAMLADLRREAKSPANLLLRENAVVPRVHASGPLRATSPAALCAESA